MSEHFGTGEILRIFLRRHPWSLLGLFVILLVEGLLAASAVLFVVPLVDFLLDQNLAAPNRITELLLHVLSTQRIAPGFWPFALLFAGSNLLKSIVDIALRSAVSRIKYRLQRSMLESALTSIYGARWSFFSRTDPGVLLDTFNKEIGLIGETMGNVAMQLARVVQLCIYLAAPLLINAAMTLTALALALVLGLPILFLQKFGYRLGVRTSATSASLIGTTSELLGAARLVLGFGRQQQARERILQKFDAYAQAHLRWIALDATVNSLNQPLGILSAVVALGVALQLGSPISEMAALLWSLLRALPVLGLLLSTQISISGLLPSYRQLQAICDSAKQHEEVRGGREFMGLTQGIEFCNVGFSYPGRGGALTGVSMFISRGGMTALIGESGSGKSTIVDLMLGLQSPDAGQVLFDGLNFEQWRQNSCRERIGYVPQDPILFNASIRDNLLWSNPNVSDHDIWAACTLANADRFIHSLPDGLATIVGDRGTSLSGGQRQRIALARALIRSPDLLILDEATSSLDVESERLIQEAINHLAATKTLLVITHKVATIARAQKIYVLRQGQIVQSGSYDELASDAHGYFARMVELQKLGEYSNS